MANQATRLNCGEVFGVEPVTIIFGQARSRKALVDTQMKEAREDHGHELDALRDLFKARKSEWMQ